MELSKLYLVPAFHDGRRWAESGNSDSDTPDATPCEEKKKFPRTASGSQEFQPQDGPGTSDGETLRIATGKLTGPTPERHPYQAMYTGDKARCVLKTMDGGFL